MASSFFRLTDVAFRALDSMLVSHFHWFLSATASHVESSGYRLPVSLRCYFTVLSGSTRPVGRLYKWRRIQSSAVIVCCGENVSNDLLGVNHSNFGYWSLQSKWALHAIRSSASQRVWTVQIEVYGAHFSSYSMSCIACRACTSTMSPWNIFHINLDVFSSASFSVVSLARLVFVIMRIKHSPSVWKPKKCNALTNSVQCW